MTKLKPIKTIAYVIYKCSECGEDSDMLRLTDVKHQHCIACPICENVDQIESIDDVQLTYKERVTPLILTREITTLQQHQYNLPKSDIDIAIKMVSKYTDDAKSIVQDVLDDENPKTIETLITKSIALIHHE